MGASALAKSLYGLFGAVYLVAGVSVLLYRTDLLPGWVLGIIDRVSGDDLNTVHVMQEFGSLLVFTGLITFWFLWHYERSGTFHWAMTAFWGLIALVHWFDVRGPFPSVNGPLVNTVPFALFASVGLVRLWAEGRGTAIRSEAVSRHCPAHRDDCSRPEATH